MEPVTLTEEWWADGSGNPVPAGDPRGRTVLYGIGARVPASVADALKALSAPVENKAVERPARTKAVGRGKS